MISLNRVQLIGHLTEDPNVRELQNWVTVADVNLLVKTIIKDSSWEDREISSFHNITFWRWLADVVKNYTKKWSQIFASWRLETDSWEDQEWNKRYKTKIVAEDLILLSRKDEAKVPDWSWKITSGVNKVDVLWNITWDLELRNTPSWTSVTSFWVATNRQWKNAQWESSDKAEFHNIVAWEKLAESVTSHAKKWSKIYVSWRVQNRSWEAPDWTKKYTTEIIAESIRVLGYVAENLPERRVNPEKDIKNEAEPVKESAKPEGTKSDGATDNAGEEFSTDIKPEDLPF